MSGTASMHRFRAGRPTQSQELDPMLLWPALALLLAGPALSLPSIAVIYSVVGFKKTAVFVALTVVMSALVGMVFGVFWG